MTLTLSRGIVGGMWSPPAPSYPHLLPEPRLSTLTLRAFDDDYTACLALKAETGCRWHTLNPVSDLTWHFSGLTAVGGAPDHEGDWLQADLGNPAFAKARRSSFGQSTSMAGVDIVRATRVSRPLHSSST